MHLTTYWTANEAHNVLAFLAELQTTIKVNYADELNAFYREIVNEEQQEYFDFEDDDIPFWTLATRALEQKITKGESPFLVSKKANNAYPQSYDKHLAHTTIVIWKR